MGLVYLLPWMVDLFGKLVGKYSSPIPYGNDSAMEWMNITLKNITFHVGLKGLIRSLQFQRPLIRWPFQKDHYVSRDLKFTIPRDYCFDGPCFTGRWFCSLATMRFIAMKKWKVPKPEVTESPSPEKQRKRQPHQTKQTTNMLCVMGFEVV